MEIVINSKYRYLKDFIYSIPGEWENIGTTIHKKRNEIKVVYLDGLDVNIKSFQIPHLVNKFAYAFLRASKAKRAYEYAHKLQNLSIETPEPIAYINCYKNNLLERSFFVSMHLSDYKMTIRDIVGRKATDKELLLRQFTRFTYFSLLKNGVHHLDYSRGNILIEKAGYMHQFSIVDINRMRFESMNRRRGLCAFSRLWAGNEELEVIGDEYAILTEQSSTEVIAELKVMNQKHKNKIIKRRAYKRKFRKIR